MAKEKRMQSEQTKTGKLKAKKQKSQSKKSPAVPKQQILSRNELRRNLKKRLLRSCPKKQLQSQSQSKRRSSGLDEVILSEGNQCPICLELMMLPTLTSCGHAYCLPCIEETLIHRKSCSICRQTIECLEFTPSKILQTVSNLVLSKLPPEGQANYKDRLLAFEEKERSRKVPFCCSVGDMVDFCQEWRWREGKIAAIEQANTQNPLITVQPIGNSTQSLSFRLSSRFLAKHRQYTTDTLSIFRSSSLRIEIFDVGDFFQYDDLLDFGAPSLIRRSAEREILNQQDSQSEFLRFTFSFEPLRQ